MPKSKGGKAAFYVQIVYCQNSEWQGTITWIEGQKEVQFRSSLELLKLLNDALDYSNERKYRNGRKNER